MQEIFVLNNINRQIAQEYLRASGLGMDLMMAIGGGADVMLKHVPEKYRNALENAVYKALENSVYAASASRRLTGRVPRFVERLIPGVTGAIGGLGGFPGAILEVPVAVTIIFRSMLEEAEKLGFETNEDTIKEALRVFALGGPLKEDDGADVAMVVTKASVTGQTINSLVKKAVPHLAGALGPKVMAQSVPVLGAISGATINTIFTRYYSKMAAVHFLMLAEAKVRGVDFEQIVAEVKEEVEKLRPKKRHSDLRSA